jgi:hypothetical protein
MRFIASRHAPVGAIILNNALTIDVNGFSPQWTAGRSRGPRNRVPATQARSVFNPRSGSLGAWTADGSLFAAARQLSLVEL